MRTVSMKENIHLHVYTIVLFVLLVGVRVWEKRSKTVSKRPLPRLLGSVLFFFSCLIGVSEFEPYTRFHIFTKKSRVKSGITYENHLSKRAIPVPIPPCGERIPIFANSSSAPLAATTCGQFARRTIESHA
jgi:hypothetical protein